MPAAKRSLRGLLKMGVPLAGIVLILASAFLATDTPSRGALAVVGSVLLLVSQLSLQERVLPNDRRLYALRAELDAFIIAVRRTNAAAAATAEERGELATFHAACDDLVQRARHIGTVTAATHGLAIVGGRSA